MTPSDENLELKSQHRLATVKTVPSGDLTWTYL